MKIAVILFACALMLAFVEAETNCNKGCPFNYDPVCGRNSAGTMRTFSNPCDMGNQNCPLPVDQHFQEVKKGACQ